MKSVNAPLFDTFVFLQCYTCGVWHAVPAQVEERKRREGEKGKGVYCPNGHCTVTSGNGDPNYRFSAQRETVVIVSAPDLLPTFTPRPPDPPAPPRPLRRGKGPDNPVECPICGRTYKNPRSLTQHKRTAHKGAE